MNPVPEPDDAFPVRPFRSTLYTPAELFAGFATGRPGSYAGTVDFRAYRSMRGAPSREIGMLRALHDQAVTECREEFLVGRRVVAIMGGHQLPRDAPAFVLVATLARELTRRGLLVVSGGGPGAMEATHLGALHAPLGDGALDQALVHLAGEAQFPRGMDRVIAPDGSLDEARLAALHAWQVRAFEVLAGVPEADRGVSLAVPTWFYGHEPPTPFATHIAKYFSNPLREDGLLGIAVDGVIYAPGSAGTLQEIFQDAAQNHYRVFHDRFSPMVFLDVDQHWSRRLPVTPILRELFGAELYDAHVTVTADPTVALEALFGDRPEPAARPA